MEETNLSIQEEPVVNIEIWDNSKRARTLKIVFWVITGLTVIGIISSFLELVLLKKALAGDFVTEQEATLNDLRQGIIGLLQTGIYITSVVVFLNWFRRAYGNLHRLGITYLKHSESMAVWTWFIPIIVLFRPVQIMSEIWRETQESLKKYDTSYKIIGGSLIIGLWWTLFIVSNLIGRYVMSVGFKQDTVEQLIEGTEAYLISDILQIPEALLVILIVHKLSTAESKLAAEVKKSGGNIVYK